MTRVLITIEPQRLIPDAGFHSTEPHLATRFAVLEVTKFRSGGRPYTRKRLLSSHLNMQRATEAQATELRRRAKPRRIFPELGGRWNRDENSPAPIARSLSEAEYAETRHGKP